MSAASVGCPTPRAPPLHQICGRPGARRRHRTRMMVSEEGGGRAVRARARAAPGAGRSRRARHARAPGGGRGRTEALRHSAATSNRPPHAHRPTMALAVASARAPTVAPRAAARRAPRTTGSCARARVQMPTRAVVGGAPALPAGEQACRNASGGSPPPPSLRNSRARACAHQHGTPPAPHPPALPPSPGAPARAQFRARG